MNFPVLFLHCLAEPTPGAHVRDPSDGNDAGKNSEQSSLKMLSVQLSWSMICSGKIRTDHAPDSCFNAFSTTDKYTQSA
jgi:hypothetical protein